MTPAEHRAEAERLLDEWQEMGAATDPMSAVGQWMQDRDHFIACAQVHALLAGPPPSGVTVTGTFASPPTVPISPTHYLTVTPAQTITSTPAAATRTGGRFG